MNATSSTPHGATTDLKFVWPLPAAKLPNARVTWAEWVAQQAATISSEQDHESIAAFQALPAPQNGVSYFDHKTSQETATRFVWPLPATKLPNARLTWAEWLDVQASSTTDAQPEQTAATRAA